MVRTQEVINEIRSILHDNLTDPNSNRRQNQAPWVFIHQPNTSQLPTIQIKDIDDNYNTLSIGNYTQFKQARIQFSVRVRTNNEYDYDTDSELETASDGLNYLISQIVDTLLTDTNQDQIQANTDSGFKGALPDIESEIIDIPESNAIQKSIDFIITIQR